MLSVIVPRRANLPALLLTPFLNINMYISLSNHNIGSDWYHPLTTNYVLVVILHFVHHARPHSRPHYFLCIFLIITTACFNPIYDVLLEARTSFILRTIYSKYQRLCGMCVVGICLVICYSTCVHPYLILEKHNLIKTRSSPSLLCIKATRLTPTPSLI